MFDHALFRRSKGGIKLHPLLEHDVYLPVWAHITEAKIHDRKILETIDPVLGLPRGSFVAVDRAYNDYAMLFGWHRKEINLVCRAKDNMSHVVSKNLDVPGKEGKPAEGEEPMSHVIADQVVTLAGKEASKDYPKEPWVVSYWIHEKKGNRSISRKVRFFIDNLRLSASMIANMYKSRWQIEAFFKLRGQNRKIKSFLGTSHDAVKTQVYVPLIAVLILRHPLASLKVQWHVPHMLATIRLILHLHGSLSGWLDRDHGASPRSPRDGRAPPGGAAGTVGQPAG
jgi:hypothetical protein